MNFEGLNKFSNARKRNVIASKLRPVKTFKSDKMLLYGRGVLVVDHDTDGRASIINILLSQRLYGT